MANWLRKAYWNTFTLWHVRKEKGLPYRPLDEILALQNRRVRAIVTHAYATVPYYREVMDGAGLRPDDFHNADDLARLPLLTSEQVAREPQRFLSRRYTEGHSLLLHSTGTSGHIKVIHYNPTALFLALAHGHRQRRVLAHFTGRTFGYCEMEARSLTSVSLQLRAFYEFHSWVPRTLDLTRGRLLLTDSIENNVARINAFRPEVLLGYGSYLGVLFRRAHERGLMSARPQVVVYGADRMVEADRLLIETAFGVPVLSSYQAVEALRIAFQCEQRQGFHISLDAVTVRVVDERGRTLEPGGTGHVVISNLTNRAIVLLNYRLGDVATLSRSTCPCGRTLPTLEHIAGRSDDFISLPREQFLHAAVVEDVLEVVPGVVQIQLVQEELRRFVLRVVSVDGAAWPQVRQRSEAALRTLLGTDCILDLERLDAIPPESGGKVRTVISYCCK